MPRTHRTRVFCPAFTWVFPGFYGSSTGDLRGVYRTLPAGLAAGALPGCGGFAWLLLRSSQAFTGVLPGMYRGLAWLLPDPPGPGQAQPGSHKAARLQDTGVLPGFCGGFTGRYDQDAGVLPNPRREEASPPRQHAGDETRVLPGIDLTCDGDIPGSCLGFTGVLRGFYRTLRPNQVLDKKPNPVVQ